MADGGNLILSRCPTEWKERLRVWGEPRADWAISERVKAALDPHQHEPGAICRYNMNWRVSGMTERRRTLMTTAESEQPAVSLRSEPAEPSRELRRSTLRGFRRRSLTAAIRNAFIAAFARRAARPISKPATRTTAREAVSI